MQNSRHWCGLAVCVTALWLATQSPGQSPAATKTAAAKPSKKQEKKIDKELGVDLGWLENEVPYIITPEERQAYLQLSTNEEREQFIESFWSRRNPDAESAVNAFKEEHYRRLAYADEHFASGIARRKTDRGRIYIIWGPPDEIDSHPMGGTYDRPMSQGGGSTTTYPWELWRYRHLEGIGENIELEFVDPSGSGEYPLHRKTLGGPLAEKIASTLVTAFALSIARSYSFVDGRHGEGTRHRF